MTPLVRELSAEETHLAHAAMLELRPGIGTVESFVERVNAVQRPEGYRLAAVLPDGSGPAVAVAGFRQLHCLASGNQLYCDDLSTRAAARGRGFAGALVDWMIEEAGRLGCDSFELDSGVGGNRVDAHRLYLNKRMRISAYHFALGLR